MVALITIVIIAACSRSPYANINNPKDEYVGYTDVYPVYIDSRFSDKQKSDIKAGIEAWNYTLNGYRRYEIISDKFDAAANVKIANNHAIEDGWMGLDIGPEATTVFKDVVLKSKTVLWNGPMGVFEMEPFSNGTRAVAGAIAEATSNGAYSLIGGGDSAAAIHQFGFAQQVSYVSTGGGALLEYFEGKVLPGVAAIEQS